MGETVNNASIAMVDEDRSALSRHLIGTLYPPYFKNPVMIEASELDSLMDQSKFMFVLVIPPRFEADVRNGRKPALQLNVDATAITQAGLGATYLQNILLDEIRQFISIVWPQFVTVAGLGTVFLGLSLMMFRRSVSIGK